MELPKPPEAKLSCLSRPQDPRKILLKKDKVKVFVLSDAYEKNEVQSDAQEDYDTENVEVEYFDSYGAISSFTAKELNDYCRDNNLKDYQVQVSYYVDRHHDLMFFYLKVYKDCDEEVYNKYLQDLEEYNKETQNYELLYNKYKEELDKFYLYEKKKAVEKELQAIKEKLGE